VRKLDVSITAARAELYKPTVKDPFHRLQIHEAIMAAGYYQRAANPNVLFGEGTRFVLNHYNNDVRRDTAITKAVHKIFHDALETIHASQRTKGSKRSSDSEQLVIKPELTESSQKLLIDILLLERRLFGEMRLTRMGGDRWICIGQRLEEFKEEEEVKRILEIGAIKGHGNFVTSVLDQEKETFYHLVLRPGKEPLDSFMESKDIKMGGTVTAEMEYAVKVFKPTPPPTRWEVLKERLLKAWVIWLSVWLMFWFVDEEIIAFTSLLILKYTSTKKLKEEARLTGQKVYIARAGAV
jgi:hypothetical protein